MISPEPMRYYLHVTERKDEATHKVTPFGLLQFKLRMTHSAWLIVEPTGAARLYRAASSD